MQTKETEQWASIMWCEKNLTGHCWLWWWGSSNNVSCIQLFASPWTVAHQAPLSMGFSRQEYWSGLPFPSPGDLLDPGIQPGSPALQADSLLHELQGSPMMMEGANKPRNSGNFCAQSFSCVWLCDPMDCSPPGSSVRGIYQARVLEWVSIFSSRRSSGPKNWTCISWGSSTGRQIFFTTEPVGKPWEARKDKKTEAPSVSRKEFSYAKCFILA